MAWLEYEYTRRYSHKTGKCIFYSPIIEVEIINGGKSIKVSAMIDSGCDTTTLDQELAQMIGVDLSKGSNVLVKGPSGGNSGGVEADIQINLEGNKFTSRVVVVKDLAFAMLLGQDNFFEYFDVLFERSKGKFSIKKVPKVRFE